MMAAVPLIVMLIACWISGGIGFVVALHYAARTYDRAVEDEMIGAWEFGFDAGRKSINQN